MYFPAPFKDITPYIADYSAENVCAQMGLADGRYLVRGTELNEGIQDLVDIAGIYPARKKLPV
jgi:hypothetical protein